MPFLDESGQPVTLSPEEQSQFWQQSGQQPPGTLVDESGKPVDPFSLPASDIANLVKQSPDKFDLVSQFAARPELQKDPATVAKVADAFHQLRESPIDWKDIAKHATENVANVIAGLGRFGLKVTSGTLKQLGSLGFAADPTASAEDAESAAVEAQKESRQELGEAAASAEQGMTGLVSGVAKTGSALARGLHLAKQLKDYTQADKVNALFDALATAKQTQSNLSGQGPLSQTVTEGYVPVRPEEVAKLTDPFSWEALGLGTRAAGAIGKGAIKTLAKNAPETTAKAAELVSKLPSTTEAVGSAITGAAKAGAAGARAVEKLAGPVGAVGAPLYAAVTHDPKLLAESLLFGSTAGEKAAMVAEKAAKGLDSAAEFGKQISSGEVKSAYAAAVRDALEAAPKAAGQLATGVGFDLSQVAGADTPQEREAAVGLGTAFGMLGAANTVGRHVLSGQIVGPRAFDTNIPINSSGQFPALDAMHNQEFSNLTPGQRTRVNAGRQYLSKANPNADVFVASAADPDNTALTQALIKSGMDANTAQRYADQNGFTTRLNGRKVIVVKEPGAAPHEAFHGIEDVLGEGTLRNIDDEIQQQYGNQWENFGRYYASRLLGRDAGENWRDTILDKSGWGAANAAEKEYAAAAQRFSDEARQNGQPPPTEQQVRDAVQAGGFDWRKSLSPEEQKAVADRYISRELLAENFDTWFKHTGGTMEPGKQIPERVAKILGKAVEFFGGNPIAGRTSEGLGVPLTPQSIETARFLGKQAAPVIEPKKVGTVAAPTAGVAPTEVAEQARKLAADQPNVPLPGQNQSQREIAGAAAEAFANDAALHLQYSSAPDEPAASLSLGMNRSDRRGLIQAFREMPDNVRQLFGKMFFPKKFVQTKSSGIQIQGWSPEVFAANAHRYGRFLADLAKSDPAAAQRLTKYEVGPSGLTEKGWTDLYNDLQNFVASHRAGKTGAGESLVVPRRVTEAGYYAPPTVGAEGQPIPQDRADVINMLFGFRLPGTEGKSTRAGGAAGVRLPQNIAGRLVSEATQPGRVSEPVSPRGAFGGAAAERQGIAGEPVMEVNPYRAQLETAAKAAGVQPPSLIESWQNLNLNRIKEAEVAPEQPKFGANPLTLQAGFMPKREVELTGPDGKKYRATFDGFQDFSAIGRGQVPQFTALEDLPGSVVARSTTYGPSLEKAGYKMPTDLAQFAPKADDVARVSDEYLKSKGIVARPSAAANINEPLMRQLADFYQTAEHAPDAPEVKKSYDALAKETVDQYNAIRKAGYAIEPYTGTGEPYKSSAEMVADVQNNKHLYYLPTTGSFGGPTDNLMLRPSGVGDAPVNDIFRAVHDFFGHAKEGYQFGPRGEFNAWREHSKMFSPEAQGALAAETLAQNSWVNFGPHLRTAEGGNIPQRGESGFVAPAERPFAAQKNLVVPEELQQQAQYQPKTFVVRHGSTEMNNANPDKDLIRGHINVPLDAKGRQEADATGKKIAAEGGVQHIITSDLDRTVDTAKAIQEHNPGATITEDEGLRPWNFGPTIEGHPTSEMLPKIRELTENPDLRPPGGETFNEFKDRFLESYHRAQDTTADANSAIVTHYRGTKLLDAWRAAGTDNDAINKAVFESYDKSKKPGNVDVIDKTGAAIENKPESEATVNQPAQFQAAKRRSKQDWELPTSTGMFSKVWITPDGKPLQLGGTFHHEYLNQNPDIAKKYGIKTPMTEDDRSIALQKGFARVNYEKNTGTLKVEARAADWPKLQESVKQLASVNLSRIDNMDVHLLDTKARKVVAQDGVALHTYSTPEEKMEQLPFIGTAGGVTEVSPQASSAGAQFLPTKANKDRITDFEKLQNESRYGSLWISPSGEVFDAKNAHLFWARDYIAPGTEDATNEALMKGWFRMANQPGYIFGETTGISSKQQTSLDEIANATGKLVVDDNNHTLAQPETENTGMVGGQYLPADAPRALRSAAIRDPETGQIFEAPFHAMAVANALGLPSYRNADERTMASFEHGFTTNEGEFLDREQAHQRALESKQIDEGRDVTKSPSFQRKGGIGIEHLKTSVLSDMEENRKNAIPNLVTQFKPADVAAFKDEKTLPDALHNSRYAILTANRESVGPANHAVNQQANDNLEKALIADGYNPVEVKGEYKGVDQGKNFLVPGMTVADALHYGKQYGQESVITPEGLAYTADNTINPAVPSDTVVGAAAKKRDAWSQLPGGPAFSMGIDFDKREPVQFKPNVAQTDLFGNPVNEEKPKAGLSTMEKSQLTKAGIAQQYPEAVVPKKRDQAIPSDIVGSPLYKEAFKRGDESAAVNAFADRLESFAKEYSDRPAFKDGAAWYDHIAPAIKKAFPKTGQVFAELLAATSPGQTPDLNFRDALQAHDRLVSGDYDKKIEKYHQGLEMAADEKKWQSWLAKHGTDLPANPTPETFLGQWIDFHDLKLTKHNGKLFGHNSVPVLNVAARKWIADAGPKTSNFVKNLLGIGNEATIDLWADRTMRWAGYEGKKERWRILPENKSGVDDKDFYFAQKVFAETAKRLGMRPDQLQGALWFAEKQRWADNGWSPLNLGTYEPEFAKIPETRAKVAQEQQLKALGAKIKPSTGTQAELMVTPRNLTAQHMPQLNKTFSDSVETHSEPARYIGTYKGNPAFESTSSYFQHVFRVEAPGKKPQFIYDPGKVTRYNQVEGYPHDQGQP